ncbi:hypothetical protein [Longimicrobium sp.]|uniref:hypothetical protein n=1 Tax=Longimicrobium sp. TaxID=2029185 RepID=UPI002C390F5E|nr:hypothetical protein [Longimicrobium sp.]HSU12587.1 hypothetical protein [Longimicrobium sp.]
MKKLKLEIEALEVESFEASESKAEAGTVEGRGWTPACDSFRICGPKDPSYDPCGPTEDLACTGTCQYSDCSCLLCG